MENFISSAAEFAEAFTLKLGISFYLLPVLPFAVLLVAISASMIFKKFRYADKKFFLPATLSFAFSHAALAINSFDKLNARFLWLSALTLSACFVLCGVLIGQSELKMRLTLQEKQLIGRLSAPNGDEPKGNVKRVEYLEKCEEEKNIEPNYNEIISIINKLRREEISPYEEDELDKTEMDMEKFSSRAPTPYERRIFSDRLLKIVKMTSKYHIA